MKLKLCCLSKKKILKMIKKKKMFSNDLTLAKKIFLKMLILLETMIILR